MLPLAGYGATGAKWLAKGFKISETTAVLVKSIGKVSENSKEIVMKTFSNTFGDAKKVVDEILDLGDNSKNYVSSMQGGPFSGKVTGKQSADVKKYWRLDFDANGQAHINWVNGKKKGRVDFGGGERQVRSIIDNVINKSK
ncbi:MAG: hypothetical protein EOO43_12785 [Flavobacterium sp.]|nr:MAG: hypothetical protein EOO43_12785 [Flavobacterium sp.]